MPAAKMAADEREARRPRGARSRRTASRRPARRALQRAAARRRNGARHCKGPAARAWRRRPAGMPPARPSGSCAARQRLRRAECGPQERAGSAGKAEHQRQISGILSTNSVRQIGRRHFRHGDQLCLRYSSCHGFSKNVSKYSAALKRIERRQYRPWPQQPHDQVSRARSAGSRHHMNWPSRAAAVRSRSRALRRQRSAARRSAAIGAAMPARMREPNAAPSPTPTSATVRAAGCRILVEARARRPSSSTAMAAANGASFGFMNMWP